MLTRPLPGRSDADLTLPSVVTALRGGRTALQPVLTIIFHPDTTRIGETTLVSPLAGTSPWLLGRRSPAFGRAAGEHGTPTALQDAHVSRRALSVVSDGEQLVLRRVPSSSRCRVAGRELRDEVRLSREQLKQGVPILLGHSVVLLLRLVRRHEFQGSGYAAPELCGSSTHMRRLRQQVTEVAAADLDVLVRGETGTGKELVAAAIHRASARQNGPMVSVNMAAIPASLAAASLFGSARGAYTGATRANQGFFSQAEDGTLFLDEIGDTPAEIQPLLLRALQEREIQAVGGAIRKVDVRVVSATDAAIDGAGCDFKAALRHRLGATEINLLPLRQHPEDIGELLLHFLTINCRQLDRLRLLPSAQSPAREIAAWAELFHRFVGYHWPGNVRELANFASQVALASVAELTLPDNIRLALQRSPPGTLQAATPIRAVQRRNMREIDDEEFDAALAANAYEVANVARQLGVSRQSIYRRIDASPRHRLAGQVPLAELELALAQREGNAAAAARDLQVSLSGLRARLRDSSLVWF